MLSGHAHGVIISHSLGLGIRKLHSNCHNMSGLDGSHGYPVPACSPLSQFLVSKSSHTYSYLQLPTAIGKPTSGQRAHMQVYVSKEEGGCNGVFLFSTLVVLF